MKHKSLKILVSSICLIISALFSTGCFYKTPPPDWEDRAVGDFNVRFYKDYCEIDGTTEEGSSKRFLVIPEYIDGVRVESLGLYNPMMLMFDPKLDFPVIKSEKIEKIYFESALKKKSPFSFDGPLPNMNKVMYLGFEQSPYYLNKGTYMVYYPRYFYENMEINHHTVARTVPANVSYYYNYEDAKNEGYYWIDDCDYGSKIEFIPKDPVRDGYEFGGWYKEAECVNEWDFESDTLPELQTEWIEATWSGGDDQADDLIEVPIYQETILYAKWTEKNEAQD